MGPVQAVRSVLRQTFRFSGRARRSEFWWWVLAYVAACALATVVDWRLDPDAFNSADPPMVVSAVVFYGLLLPHMAVTARRLHDRAFSTWWLLLHLLPFGVIVVLVLCAFDSWEGPTRFGPDPKGRPEPPQQPSPSSPGSRDLSTVRAAYAPSAAGAPGAPGARPARVGTMLSAYLVPAGGGPT